MASNEAPDIVVGRLPIYLRALTFMGEEGREITSSQELSEKLGISSAQIRKDLSHFGEFGKQGTGYEISYLRDQLKRILHVDHTWPVALVGCGDLGHALANYAGFAAKGFEIVALFDDAPSKIGQQVAGKEVMTPRFDFVTGRRSPESDWVPLQLEDHQVLSIEGIHGLNDRLTETVPRDRKYRIFISALSQLAIDDHNRIFTADARLVRRIVRDNLFRGFSAERTLDLTRERDRVLSTYLAGSTGDDLPGEDVSGAEPCSIEYPVLEYPKKITAQASFQPVPSSQWIGGDPLPF